MKFIKSVVIVTFAPIITLFSYLTPISAKEVCATGNCALACNRQSRSCGLYSRSSVPSGYLRVSYMPNGYKRTGGSECSAIRCPDGSSTCQRWGIAKKSQ